MLLPQGIGSPNPNPNLPSPATFVFEKHFTEFFANAVMIAIHVSVYVMINIREKVHQGMKNFANESGSLAHYTPQSKGKGGLLTLHTSNCTRARKLDTTNQIQGL